MKSAILYTFTSSSLTFENSPLINIIEQLTEFNGRRYVLSTPETNIHLTSGFSGWRRVALHVAQITLLPLTLVACFYKWTYRFLSSKTKEIQRFHSPQYASLFQELDDWASQASGSFRISREWVKKELLIAFIKQLTSINLNGDTAKNGEVDELPDCFGYFPFLTSLYCAKNQLIALPASLGNCKQLTTLCCSFNQLKAIPDSLGSLPAAHAFFFNGNHLTDIPDQLLPLFQISQLYLQDNHFSQQTLARLTPFTAASKTKGIVSIY